MIGAPSVRPGRRFGEAGWYLAERTSWLHHKVARGYRGSPTHGQAMALVPKIPVGENCRRQPSKLLIVPAALLPRLHEVAEPGELALEAEVYRADGAVTLLADHHLGAAV